MLNMDSTFCAQVLIHLDRYVATKECMAHAQAIFAVVNSVFISRAHRLKSEEILFLFFCGGGEEG